MATTDSPSAPRPRHRQPAAARPACAIRLPTCRPGIGRVHPGSAIAFLARSSAELSPTTIRLVGGRVGSTREGSGVSRPFPWRGIPSAPRRGSPRRTPRGPSQRWEPGRRAPRRDWSRTPCRGTRRRSPATAVRRSSRVFCSGTRRSNGEWYRWITVASVASVWAGSTMLVKLLSCSSAFKSSKRASPSSIPAMKSLVRSSSSTKSL